MLTFLDMSEIRAIEKAMSEPGYTPNTRKNVSPRKSPGLFTAMRDWRPLCASRKEIAPGADAKLSGAVLQELAADMPNASLTYDEVVGQKFVDIAAKSGLVPSKSEGTRLVKNGGAYLNNERISDPSFSISPSDLIDGTYLLFSAGKKKRMLIRVHPVK